MSTISSPLLELDVRPLLEQGDDPMPRILEVLGDLRPDGLLLLSAPVGSNALIASLKERGCRPQVNQLDSDHWQVEVSHKTTPQIADYRDLPAPEPLERILAQVTELPISHAFIVRVPHMPQLLFPVLEQRKLQWCALAQADGSAIVHIRKEETAP
ncbi:MAG: hypothetical protein CL395_04275 [Acidiferrobacteraceae bacterium]|jgi:hypothetical protein|nr:hypothetical protein [Acidiferrobacteraceae bacterium]MCP4829397.1 DUF2249 domain-containing protein [Pseudomonadota bacterium]HJP07410.1 DUF2249 domain-containing protein [Arenicellales bacterium]